MNWEFILFSLFSGLAILSATMVISLSNAVHSVLFLILVFCNVAGLLLVSGAEFMAFMLLIVYVGAIAVLFLFVVMMLNIKITNKNKNFWSTLPIGTIIFLSFLFQFISIYDIKLNYLFSLKNNNYIIWNNWFQENNYLTNIETIGYVLYTKYSFVFLLSGFILLIAMIGAIVLTMHQKSNIKKQFINLQLGRNYSGAVKFIYLRK